MIDLWRIELFGGLRVIGGGQIITRFPAGKARALLSRLAYFLHREHPREELMELFWPEVEPGVGRLRLRVAINSLRHQLEPPGILAGGVLLARKDALHLNPAAVVTDTAEFEESLRAARSSGTDRERIPHLLRAVQLHKAELLPGDYEEWVVAERMRLADAFLNALRQLAALEEQTGDPSSGSGQALERALDYARRAVAADPLREESYQDLIRLLALTDRKLEARAQYRQLRRLLREHLGTTPLPETRRLIETLPLRRRPQQKGGPEHEQERELEETLSLLAPSSTPVPQPIVRLPLTLTRFFGREEEIEMLRVACCVSRVEDETRNTQYARLVTLTGPGGSGKTRLSIETAQRAANAFAGGVFFVPLADLTNPRLIPEALLITLNVPRSPESEQEPLEQVVDFLNGVSIKHSVFSIEEAGSILNTQYSTLLLLDNLEQLLDDGDDRPPSLTVASLVRTLLERVPHLTVLATSRRSLGIEGEQEFPVEPLPIPVDGSWLMVDGKPSINHHPSTINQIPSVALFVDRAQAVKPDFQVTPGNVEAVAALCEKLEGIPLAVELAAGWARMLTPAQMLERMERRFELLVSRQGGRPPRHRTLQAAMEWSYDLLSPLLRRFFARLSLFRGGWTLEAAEQVSGDWVIGSLGIPITQSPNHPTTQDLLTQLCERSLIFSEETETGMRCRMLETVREYAARCLAPEERGEAARRHAEWCLKVAEEAMPNLRGPEQARWLTLLDGERENLRAAIEWSLETEEEEEGDSSSSSEIGVRLAIALSLFWRTRGHYREGRALLAAVTARAKAHGSSAELARALNAAAHLAQAQGDYAVARSLSEEGLAMGRALGDTRSIATALGNLGAMAAEQGDFAAARSLFEESLALLRQLGEKPAVANLLNNLGNLAWNQSDYGGARSLYEESLAHYRELGDRRGASIALNNLGAIAWTQGDNASARQRYEESLAAKRALGDKFGMAATLNNLGILARDQGDYRSARTLLKESLAIWREIGGKQGGVEALESSAGLAAADGQPGRAARLFGAAEALRESIGTPLPPTDRERRDRTIAELRATLGEAAFTAAWAEGAALDTEAAISYALSDVD